MYTTETVTKGRRKKFCVSAGFPFPQAAIVSRSPNWMATDRCLIGAGVRYLIISESGPVSAESRIRSRLAMLLPVGESAGWPERLQSPVPSGLDCTISGATSGAVHLSCTRGGLAGGRGRGHRDVACQSTKRLSQLSNRHLRSDLDYPGCETLNEPDDPWQMKAPQCELAGYLFLMTCCACRRALAFPSPCNSRS